MIVVDSSALLAIVLDEPSAARCLSVLNQGGRLLISAATLTEILIVSQRKGVESTLVRFMRDWEWEVLPVDETSARRAAEVYRKWGKGHHPARLNFGDCFSYDLALQHGCPLLFVGADFSATDVRPAMTTSAE